MWATGRFCHIYGGLSRLLEEHFCFAHYLLGHAAESDPLKELLKDRRLQGIITSIEQDSNREKASI